jgi:hypothetical protein
MPDQQDPDAYCHTCEYKYRSTPDHHIHLNHTHKIIVEKLPSSTIAIIYPHLSPEQHNPNNYCCTCERISAVSIVTKIT